MIVDFPGVSADALLVNLIGLAMLLGAVMLMLSRAMHGIDRRHRATGDRPMLVPVPLRISRRAARRVSHCSTDGFPSPMPSRAPPTLSRSARGLHRSPDESGSSLE